LTLQHLTTSTLIAIGFGKMAQSIRVRIWSQVAAVHSFDLKKTTKTLHKMWSRYNYKMMTLSLSFIEIHSFFLSANNKMQYIFTQKICDSL